MNVCLTYQSSIIKNICTTVTRYLFRSPIFKTLRTQLIILHIPSAETEELNKKKRSQLEQVPFLQFEKVLQDHETAREYRHKLSQGFSQAVIKKTNQCFPSSRMSNLNISKIRR